MAIKGNLRVLIAEKEQAEKRRLTYRELSEKTGISTNSISKIANDQFSMIGLKTLNALCNFFQVGPEKILLWTPDGTEG